MDDEARRRVLQALKVVMAHSLAQRFFNRWDAKGTQTSPCPAMDLDRVLAKLQGGGYSSQHSVRSDVQQIWTHCRQHPERGSDLHSAAERMESYFENTWRQHVDSSGGTMGGTFIDDGGGGGGGGGGGSNGCSSVGGDAQFPDERFLDVDDGDDDALMMLIGASGGELPGGAELMPGASPGGFLSFEPGGAHTLIGKPRRDVAAVSSAPLRVTSTSDTLTKPAVLKRSRHAERPDDAFAGYLGDWESQSVAGGRGFKRADVLESDEEKTNSLGEDQLIDFEGGLAGDVGSAAMLQYRQDSHPGRIASSTLGETAFGRAGSGPINRLAPVVSQRQAPPGGKPKSHVVPPTPKAAVVPPTTAAEFLGGVPQGPASQHFEYEAAAESLGGGCSSAGLSHHSLNHAVPSSATPVVTVAPAPPLMRRCAMCQKLKKGRCGTDASSLRCLNRRPAGLPYTDEYGNIVTPPDYIPPPRVDDERPTPPAVSMQKRPAAPARVASSGGGGRHRAPRRVSSDSMDDELDYDAKGTHSRPLRHSQRMSVRDAVPFPVGQATLGPKSSLHSVAHHHVERSSLAATSAAAAAGALNGGGGGSATGGGTSLRVLRSGGIGGTGGSATASHLGPLLQPLSDADLLEAPGPNATLAEQAQWRIRQMQAIQLSSVGGDGDSNDDSRGGLMGRTAPPVPPALASMDGDEDDDSLLVVPPGASLAWADGTGLGGNDMAAGQLDDALPGISSSHLSLKWRAGGTDVNKDTSSSGGDKTAAARRLLPLRAVAAGRDGSSRRGSGEGCDEGGGGYLEAEGEGEVAALTAELEALDKQWGAQEREASARRSKLVSEMAAKDKETARLTTSIAAAAAARERAHVLIQASEEAARQLSAATSRLEALGAQAAALEAQAAAPESLQPLLQRCYHQGHTQAGQRISANSQGPSTSRAPQRAPGNQEAVPPVGSIPPVFPASPSPLAPITRIKTEEVDPSFVGTAPFLSNGFSDTVQASAEQGARVKSEQYSADGVASVPPDHTHGLDRSMVAPEPSGRSEGGTLGTHAHNGGTAVLPLGARGFDSVTGTSVGGTEANVSRVVTEERLRAVQLSLLGGTTAGVPRHYGLSAYQSSRTVPFDAGLYQLGLKLFGA